MCLCTGGRVCYSLLYVIPVLCFLAIPGMEGHGLVADRARDTALMVAANMAEATQAPFFLSDSFLQRNCNVTADFVKATSIPVSKAEMPRFLSRTIPEVSLQRDGQTVG